MIFKKLLVKIKPEYVIKESILFNDEWYSNQYGIPVEKCAFHYLNEGYKLGYNPSVLFDSKAYIKHNQDLKDINPLLHYELYGKKEKRIISTTRSSYGQDGEVYLNNLLKYINKSEITYDLNKTVTIVIPVYNGYELLKVCLESIKKYTNKDVDIVLVDDCSSDERIKPLLEKYNKEKSFHIYKNDNNLGFVKTMNKAMSMVKTDIAIWLNTDTQVCENWVEKLVHPFDKYDNLASATPFSNSATTFSFPKFLKNNEMLASVEEVNKAFSRIRSLYDGLDETYSGTGFCMAVNMKAWNEIGNLDEINFEKGYGEENDWCFRATEHGYIHLLVPNLFIQHKHGGSFDSEDRKKYIEEHNKLLIKKYAKIMKKDVPAFLDVDSWKQYRYIAGLLLSNNAVLYIDLDNKSEYDFDKYKNSKGSVILLKHDDDDRWSINLPLIDEDIIIYLSSFSDIYNLFEIIKIKELSVNNLEYLDNNKDLNRVLRDIKDKYKL